jgi:hypothetical protein
MDSDRANRSFTRISAKLVKKVTESHLRVPQTDLLRRPFGSSTAAHYHCAARRRATAVTGEKRGLKTTCQDSRVLGNAGGVPFTRLLLDSNFVSITDMADCKEWQSRDKSEQVNW